MPVSTVYLDIKNDFHLALANLDVASLIKSIQGGKKPSAGENNTAPDDGAENTPAEGNTTEEEASKGILSVLLGNINNPFVPAL